MQLAVLIAVIFSSSFIDAGEIWFSVACIFLLELVDICENASFSDMPETSLVRGTFV